MAQTETHHTHLDTIQELQQQIRACERGRQSSAAEVRSTGCEALDALFPSRGIRQGSLVEWLGSSPAGGAETVSLLTARNLFSADSPVVLIDQRRDLFLLSLKMMGVDLSRLVLIRPTSFQQGLWALEESLRSPAVGLVWANLDGLTNTVYRRLQLAAEQSGTVGFLVRSAEARGAPSWAETRLLVSPQPATAKSLCYQVQVASRFGQQYRTTAHLGIHRVTGQFHENPPATNSVPLVSPVERATTARFAAGA